MNMIHQGLADPVGEKDKKKLMLSINQLYEKIDSNLKYLYKKYQSLYLYSFLKFDLYNEN